MDQQDIIFAPDHRVVFASNTFIDVPVILQYEAVPLIDCLDHVAGGGRLKVNIYGDDGVKLAVMKGSRLIATQEGQSAGLVLRHFDGLTVCERNKQTLFEAKRLGPAAWNLGAELYSPDGTFVQSHGIVSALAGKSGDSALQMGGVFISNSEFRGFAVGCLYRRDGSVIIGVGTLPDDLLYQDGNVPEIEVKRLGLTPQWKKQDTPEYES